MVDCAITCWREGAEGHIDKRATKYMGVDVYPNHSEAEPRVLYRVEPERVQTMG